ncbi:MAG: hypothetical protein KH355_07980 [Clostridiales bacterium]|nr:hypothetical protein [Clostridiales bacterium]
MKKIKSRTIFFVVAVIAVGIIIFSQSDFIGISASHVEEDARKSQRIIKNFR